MELVGKFVPCEVRNLVLAAGRPTTVRIDARPGVTRTLQLQLPDGLEGAVLTFTTLDDVGRELASWRRTWYSHFRPLRLAFRPQATRLVVSDAEGRRGEAPLAGDDVRIVLQ